MNTQIQVEGLVLIAGLVATTALVLAADRALSRRLLVAFARMTVQLAILAAILGWLFARNDPVTTLAALCAISVLGGLETANRTGRLARASVIARCAGVLALSGVIIVVPAVVIAVSPEPWHDARFVVPIFGMTVGSSITGSAVAVSLLGRTVQDRRSAIEAQLSLGRSFNEATGRIAREAVAAGMLPVVTATAATGLVTIPGMMSGQILAGASPADAIRYQIFVMALIAAVTAVSVRTGVFLELRRWTDRRGRLRQPTG